MTRPAYGSTDISMNNDGYDRGLSGGFWDEEEESIQEPIINESNDIATELAATEQTKPTNGTAETTKVDLDDIKPLYDAKDVPDITKFMKKLASTSSTLYEGTWAVDSE